MEENERREWSELRFSSQNQNDEFDTIINGKCRTALQRLAQRYKRFSNMALCFILMCIPLGFQRILPDCTAKWFIVALYGVLMLVSSTMDRWLYIGISSIDVATMTVSEVIRLATFYRKRHLQFIMILLPMALLFLGGMFWLVSDDKDTFYLGGMITGAVVGLVIGLREFRKFMDDYRDIKK